MPNKTILNWSGGKDSMLALHYLNEDDQFTVNQLLTSISSKYDRVSMHGVSKELIERQATSLGLQLQLIRIPESSDNLSYEQVMTNILMLYQKEGINSAAFGDIFLEDLKDYRVKNLNKVGIEGVFPLWKKNTKELINEFIELGYKAIIVCVDGSKLSKDFVGRTLDKEFLKDLPPGVDPCGENGEFHSFVYDGPLFKNQIEFRVCEVVERYYESPVNQDKSSVFYFQELLAV